MAMTPEERRVLSALAATVAAQGNAIRELASLADLAAAPQAGVALAVAQSELAAALEALGPDPRPGEMREQFGS